VCGGWPELPQGQGVRCTGFFSDDGTWAHCTRENYAGTLRPTNAAEPTYAHLLDGACRCGMQHLGSLLPDEPARVKRHRRLIAIEAEAANHPPARIISHELVDAEGTVVGEHCRRVYLDEDGTPWRAKDGPWWMRHNGRSSTEMPLYGLPALLAAAPDEPAVATEGETAADALNARGVLAVGTVTGAGAIPCDLSLMPLVTRPVVLWADHDAEGLAHMRRIAARLAELGATDVAIVEWRGAKKGADAVDYFQAGNTVEGLADLPEVPAVDAPSVTGGHDGEQQPPKEPPQQPQRSGATSQEQQQGKRDHGTKSSSQSSARSASPGDQRTTGDDAKEWKPNTTSAAELLAKEFGPVNWFVQDVVPEGLTLLAAKPKKGKSTLALAIALAIYYGGLVAGHFPTQQAEVLYLALEDNERRMQRRLRRMLQDEQSGAPKGVHLEYEWPAMDRGGLQWLQTWLDEHPAVKVVVVDTLEHLRPARRLSDGVYGGDYAAVRGLQQLAGKRRIAILAITHLRKAGADDPFDEISGSTGLLGGVDGAIVMRPNQGLLDVHRKGRDFEDEAVFSLKGDPETLLWAWQGEAKTVHQGATRQKIVVCLTALAERVAQIKAEDKDAVVSDTMTPAEIAADIEEKPENVRVTLFRMKEDRDPLIEQVGRGYRRTATQRPTA
jgi:hypothetical protein